MAPSSTPPVRLARSRPRAAPQQTRASPLTATPANKPSADTAIQTAPGKRATKGTMRRAAAPAPSSRSVMGRATLTVDATSTQSSPAQNPPPSPIWASAQKISVAKGGWAATCVVHTTLPSTPGPNAMKSVNVATKAAGSTMRGRSCRYSLGSSRISVQPFARPSTNRREHNQATFSSQPARSRRRQPSTAALHCRRRPTSTQPTASGVPQPRCGCQCARTGGVGRTIGNPRRSRSWPTAADTAIRARAAANAMGSAHRPFGACPSGSPPGSARGVGSDTIFATAPSSFPASSAGPDHR